MYGGVYIRPSGNDIQTQPSVTSRLNDLELYDADRYFCLTDGVVVDSGSVAINSQPSQALSGGQA